MKSDFFFGISAGCLIAIAVTVTTALAAAPVRPPCFVPIRYIDNSDGDTFTADVLLSFDITLREQKIRIKDFDAFETSTARKTVTVTIDEIKKGGIAKKALSDLLRNADRLYVTGTPNRDMSYERLVAEVWVDEKGGGSELVKVADVMRRGGHERK